MEKWKKFCQRKDVIFTLQRYGIDALGAMAQGLFCTLLVGTILNTIGTQFGIAFLQDAIVSIGKGEGAVSYTIGGLCSAMVGPGIAVAIGFALHCPSLVLFSLIPVGFAANAMGGAGGPLSVYFVAIVAAECGKLVSKETKIDILVTPIVTICAALSLTGLAGGAAVAGCCAQMVGFAVMSFRENRWGGLVAQGVGTSMLQMPNIVKNPKIWIPPTLASAITGPLATCLFKLEMNGAAVSSGMGTCGFVGQIGVYTGWLSDVASGAKTAITPMDWVGLVLICFVLPAALSWFFCEVLRKKGWIGENDLKLDL